MVLLALFACGASHATDFRPQGGPGGEGFRSECTGQFVVGVTIQAGAWATMIGLKCAPFNEAKGRFGEPWNKALHGGRSRDPFKTALCPGQRFISGMRFGFTRDGSEPKYLDFVEIFCQPVSGRGDTIAVCIDTGHGCWNTPPNMPGGIAPTVKIHSPQVCPRGEAVTGITGRSGLYVDAVGLICRAQPKKRG